MVYLKTAYEKAKSAGKLTTDKVWLNFGFHFSNIDGKVVSDELEIPWANAPEWLKILRVSSNEFEKGTKFYWVENGQLCVGKDSNPLPLSAMEGVRRLC